jgi:hypothetical protein
LEQLVIRLRVSYLTSEITKVKQVLMKKNKYIIKSINYIFI